MKPNPDPRQELAGLPTPLTAWKLDRIENPLHRSVPDTDNGDSHAVPSSHRAVFVIPRGRGNGFRASIRGNILELADPSSGEAFGPTPDDLFIVAIASGFAWSARSVLRASGLPDDVSISANWQTREDLPGVSDLRLTVTVSRQAAAVRGALATAMDESLAARPLAAPVVHISVEGVN